MIAQRYVYVMVTILVATITSQLSSRGFSGGGGGFHGGGTTLYDAIYLGSNDLMQKPQGRKAIVVLTDGEDRGSMETLNQAIAAAQRAETVVYAIYFKGEQHGYGGHGGVGGRGGGFPGGGGRGGKGSSTCLFSTSAAAAERLVV